MCELKTKIKWKIDKNYEILTPSKKIIILLCMYKWMYFLYLLQRHGEKTVLKQ